ncbi:MAG: hypothetical protein COU27_01615 [Candidatus Levybacteria bacterium CG10_big_fil_rev_8_21_14_0_10_36_7]|nr:MAG: hypothetical protein COU27_01615 [Candidatus Levybacteria bacterium CG10_big_fil_rev_8_21_14_0_10_36_7]
MDNHPIPEDVIGFKFKLIGSITVKQFLYLLSSGILIAAVLVFPVFVIVKIPFITIFALVGLSLAFLPVDGRPLDVMLLNFLKTLPSENRYSYQKRDGNTKILSGQNLQTGSFVPVLNNNDERARREILLNPALPPKFVPDEKESGFFEKIKSFFENEKPNSQLPPPTHPQTMNLPNLKPAVLENNSSREQLQKDLLSAKQLQLQNNTPEIQTKIETLQNLLSQSAQRQAELGEKVINEQIKNTQDQRSTPDPSGDFKQKSQSTHLATPQSQFDAGFPSLPEVGNVVIGLIKDPRGKALPNILVEVIDKNNTPVRTLKTNSLGQFMSATQLANDTYQIFFEDPQKKHEFQPIEVSLNGNIFQPLEVISIDPRERLRRELFDGQKN